MGKKKINIVEGIKSKKGLIGEFKEFISRGNVIDLAVGVVMGSAFTAIVTPLIGLIMGGIDFSDLKVTIPSAIEGVKDAEICYGKFIQAVINFLIVSLVIFFVIKAMNSLKRKKEEVKEEEKPAEPTEDILLLREIRDSLKK